MFSCRFNCRFNCRFSSRLSCIRALATALSSAVLMTILAAGTALANAESCAITRPSSALAAMTVEELGLEYCSAATRSSCSKYLVTLSKVLKDTHGKSPGYCGQSIIDPVGEPAARICGEWKLHDYTIGMKPEQALDVRDTQQTRGGYRVISADGYTGRLKFDRYGLRRYQARIQKKRSTPAFFEVLVAVLTDHFGAPYSSNTRPHSQSIKTRDYAQPQDPARGKSSNLLLWKSTDCNVVVGLNTVTHKKSGTRVKSLFIERLSSFKASLK